MCGVRTPFSTDVVDGYGSCVPTVLGGHGVAAVHLVRGTGPMQLHGEGVDPGTEDGADVGSQNGHPEPVVVSEAANRQSIRRYE